MTVAALIILLTTEQPNMMRVFKFQESPKPHIIMNYYHCDNIAEAGINYNQYLTAFGQILDGLSHLHVKEVAHRNLKPKNFLVEMNPFFRVVITDFGFAKIVTNNMLLKTFYGTYKYLAPEVFPGISNGHGHKVDL